MADQRWDRVWELFFAALEQPPEAREAAVRAAAADDAELQREVLELLAAHQTQADVLDHPPVFGGEPADALGGEDPLLGTSLGPYHLESVIGSGGMGTVYAAEQMRPVHRRVACKVIREGLESHEVIARFEAEREALALMNHSAIARVFDAGTTDSGRPYFVMELIDGQPITEVCDARRLGLAARLELLAMVCDGVQHAHQKGIIHRDLKPSNVLVTTEGERLLPKIIDFGVAKALHQSLTAEPLVTTIGQLVGTPVYMSPEQVGRDGGGIDTRSDIYSLSVILYELLTGVTPFDAALIRRSGLAEFERILRTQAVDPPTRRLRREPQARLSELAALRNTTPADLLRRLHGDLDAIVLKGLAKEPGERYATAVELAADLRRHGRGDPVIARAPTRAYRARKFVRRHRAAVAAVTAVATLVVTFGITVTVQAVRLSRALRQTALERDRSDRVAGFLTHLFSLADPNVSNGDAVTVRSVLDRGAAEIDRELRGQPATHAALLGSMADAYRSLGLYERSATLIAQAVEARRRVPSDADGLASTLHLRGELEKDRGQIADAERDYRDALALRRHRRDLQTSDLLADLAILLRDRGAYAEATERAVEAVALRRALRPEPTAELAEGLLTLARCYQLQGDRHAAAPLYEEGLAMMRGLYGDDHVRVAEALNFYAMLLREDGHYLQAAALLRQALAIYRHVLGSDHSYVAVNLINLAGVDFYLGNYRSARDGSVEALGIYEKLFGADNSAIAPAALIFGNAAAALGDLPGAEANLRRALAIDLATEGEETADVAGDFEVLGTILRDEGRLAEAEPLHAKALALRLKLLGAAHAGTAGSRASLGVDHALAGRYSAGVAEIEAALTALGQKYGRRHVRVAGAIYWLGRVRDWSGDLPAAEMAQREALTLRRDLLGDQHADTAASKNALAEVLAERGAWKEARQLYEEALATREAVLPAEHPEVAATALGLAAALCGDGEADRGRALVAKFATRLERSLPGSDPRRRPAAAARQRCTSTPGA